jgi:hypothetical protein
MTETTSDTLRREALLHARAVGAIEQFLDELSIPSAYVVARCLLVRLANLPNPILLTTGTELEAMEGVAQACDHFEKQLAYARLLLVRKNEALLTIADPAMWRVEWTGTSVDDRTEYVWNGENDPVTFARREADATEPDNRGGTPS